MQATGFATDSVVDTLDAVSRLHAVRADADAGLFELAAHFADLHAGESLAPTGSSGGAAGPGAVGARRWSRHTGGGGVRVRRARRADADVAVLGPAAGGGRFGRPAPAAVDLGARRTSGGASLERTAGGRPDAAPVGGGGGVRGCGDGRVRGRFVAVGSVRDPARRQGGRRGPAGGGRPRGGRRDGAVRSTVAFVRAGDGRVLPALDGRGGRPGRGECRVPGRRAGRVRRPRHRGPAAGEGDGGARQPGQGCRAAGRVCSAAGPDHGRAARCSGWSRHARPAGGRTVDADGRVRAAGRVHADAAPGLPGPRGRGQPRPSPSTGPTCCRR